MTYFVSTLKEIMSHILERFVKCHVLIYDEIVSLTQLCQSKSKIDLILKHLYSIMKVCRK